LTLKIADPCGLAAPWPGAILRRAWRSSPSIKFRPRHKANFAQCLYDFQNTRCSEAFSNKWRLCARGKESSMVEATTPTRRPRLGAHGMMFRRRRIFARLREGFTYEEIANEERVDDHPHPADRVQGAPTALSRQRRDHAKLQLERLVPAIQLAAGAIAAGDVSAIMPYLKALDRLDRYQTVASAEGVYDDEARKKLLDKISRLADNLGIDENFAAAVQAHLRKTGQLPADELDEAGGEGAELAAAPEFMGEADAAQASPAEAQADSGFLLESLVMY
jgi:hypothetical protein